MAYLLRMSVTPNLQAIYSKWEKRGPARDEQNDSNVQRILQDGRQKWKEKFGDNFKPRKNKQRVLPIEKVSCSIITQFKTVPMITAESLVTTRPLMGSCCSCLPYSQKDFNISSYNLGIHNILDVTCGVRPKTFVQKRFQKLAYTLGRNTSHRYKDVLMFVLTAPRVREAVHTEMDKASSASRIGKIEKKPLQVLTAMKANISNRLIKFTAWCLLNVLSVMLNGVHVNKNQMAVIKKASERGIPMIYLPLHLSHLDYILVTFILWNYDIKAPYVAAGDNLNIPVFNLLLRGLGGFFIRRKLDKVAGQKDIIYRATLHTYMQEILHSGEDLEFFLEGGRSRSGRAYHPKGGLLSVVIDTLKEGIVEDVYIVPIGINYDKILDGNFCNEEMGMPKKQETFFGAVKGILKVLREHYGSVRVDFCHPFSLKEYMQRNIEVLSSDDDLTDTPSSVKSFSSSSSLYGTDVVIEEQRKTIEDLAEHVLYCSVHSQALMCTNLVAFLLLTKHREGTGIIQLISDVDWLRGELRYRKRDAGFVGETKDVVEYALDLLTDKLVMQINETNIKPCTEMPHVFELSYYANPVLSVFLLDSVVACSVIFQCNINLSTIQIFSKYHPSSRDDILTTAQSICKLLKNDFLFCPPCKKLELELADTLDELVTSEILRVQEDNMVIRDQQQKWAHNLSATVSWDDEDDGEGFSEQLLEVNTHHVGCIQKLTFLYSVLAPILESYYLTALHISKDLTVELPEDNFISVLHHHAKSRVENGLASFSESAALTTLKNAVKGFQDLKVIDVYSAGNIRMIELKDHFQVWNKLNYYLDVLETLRN